MAKSLPALLVASLAPMATACDSPENAAEAAVPPLFERAEPPAAQADDTIMTRAPELPQAGAANTSSERDPWQATDPAMPWTRWHDAHPWLTDISSWFAHFDGSPGRMTRRFEGAFGIGNGEVFGLIGLGRPLNTLANVAGPDYQQSQNFFGESSVHLNVGGQEPDFASQWAFRTRETAINGTLGTTASGVSLYTTDFAPPGAPVIVRIINVANTGRQPREVAVVWRQVFDADEAFDFRGGMVHQQRSDHHSWVASLGGDAPFEVNGETLRAHLGEVGAGDERQLVLVHTFTESDDPAQASAIMTQLQDTGVDTLLTQTRDHWRTWLAQGASLTSPSIRFDDL